MNGPVASRRFGPSRGEKDLRKKVEMCARVSSYAERFINSPSAATMAFHDRNDSFNGIQPRSVRRIEKQLYPYRIGKGSNAKRAVKYTIFQ